MTMIGCGDDHTKYSVITPTSTHSISLSEWKEKQGDRVDTGEWEKKSGEQITNVSVDAFSQFYIRY